ncbi:MAG: bacteriohemerythrin [Roseateles sp.]|nr:MAG: bacteriohemerythrin [Roseateles sp.]
MDGDHRHLVGLVNQLHYAMAMGQGSDVLGTILASLIAYTQEHFKREEEYMQRIGYARRAEHKREHDTLIQEVLALEQQFRTGRGLLTVRVSKFLKVWLLNHIAQSDRAFVLAMTT